MFGMGTGVALALWPPAIVIRLRGEADASGVSRTDLLCIEQIRNVRWSCFDSAVEQTFGVQPGVEAAPPRCSPGKPVGGGTAVKPHG